MASPRHKRNVADNAGPPVLLTGEWKKHDRTLEQRDAVLRKQLERTKKIFPEGVSTDGRIALASADVFVEKAQMRLTIRAGVLSTNGVLLGLAALFLALYTAHHLFESMNPFKSPWDKGMTATKFDYVLYALRATAAAGFVASALYFLVSLSKACLDEAMTLYNRRHALRFGRLYIYVRRGRVQNIREFEDAFRWNESFSSSFRHINPDKLPKGATAELLKLLTETVKTAKEISRQKGDAAVKGTEET